MAFPAPDLSVILGPDQNLTVQTINDQIIPLLLTHFSNLRSSIPRQSTPAPITTESTDPNTTGLEAEKPKLKSKNWIKAKIKIKTKTKTKTKTKKNGDSNDGSGQWDASNDGAQLCEHIDRLHRDLSYIREELDRLKKIEDSMGGLVRVLVEHCTNAFRGLKQAQAEAVDPDDCSSGSNTSLELHQMQIKLSLVTYIISRLKLQIPLSHRTVSTNSDSLRNEHALQEIVADSTFDNLPEPGVGRNNLWSSTYRDFCSTYQSLDPQLKLCLLCFAVFPEQAVIKKRVMSYWWIGEGLVDVKVTGQRDSAGDVLKELASKGFIRPINKKRRLGAKSYRMLPIVRLMVINLAKESKFFDFDSKGYPTAKFSESLRGCLVKSEQGSLQNALKTNPALDFERLHTLFNVNEEFLDFKLDWFVKMRNMSVLSLGRWEGSPDHHIEVEGTEFFKGLAVMKHLKFFSLQGISRISKLPNSIGELHKLQILDLRACHNLESLPDGISKLKELTNLDVSGCYLLDSLPKGIGSLSKLEVLMGFVVNDLKGGSSCTLYDLVKLRKLRKLGIVTSRRSFPVRRELSVLRRLRALKKLTIIWGGNCFLSNSPKVTKTSPNSQKDSLPSWLEKLDLQCYPSAEPPVWLTPRKLNKLRSLYIRGGNLHLLGKEPEGKENAKWTVKILRLKYLNEFRMNWIELRDSFPELACLEKINCPRLTLFPCDETGVWLNEEHDEASRFKEKGGGGIAA